MRALVRIFAISILGLLSLTLKATTLRNVSLDDVVDNANEVVLLRIVEAKLLEIEQSPDKSLPPKRIESEQYEEEVPFNAIFSNNCGVNVKAKIIHDYKSSEKEYVHFTTMEHVEVGTSYLSFLNKIESQNWYASIFKSFTIGGKNAGDHINEVKCLKNTMPLKALSFPQRLMKYDESKWLEVSLNNIIFPGEIIMKAEGEQSVIQQYNGKQIDFDSFHNYLLELKNKRSSNKKSEVEAKHAQHN